MTKMTKLNREANRERSEKFDLTAKTLSNHTGSSFCAVSLCVLGQEGVAGSPP